MCSCFSNLAGEQLIPSNDHPPRRSSRPQPPLQSKLPSKRAPATKQLAEAYIPSWQHTEPVTTGRRSRGASASIPVNNSSDPNPGVSVDKRCDDPTGNMLYFGTDLSPEQAMRAYKSPTPVSSSSLPNAGKSSGSGAAAAAGNASGRDASGYLSSSVGSSNGMNGMYSSLTYGGSLQYNFAGTQSYGPGTAGVAGNGLM